MWESGWVGGEGLLPVLTVLLPRMLVLPLLAPKAWALERRKAAAAVAVRRKRAMVVVGFFVCALCAVCLVVTRGKG